MGVNIEYLETKKNHLFEPNLWRVEDRFKPKIFYYAIVHDNINGDFVYHSIASKGKNQWQFDTAAKLKISITNGYTGSGYGTNEMIEAGYIEIKTCEVNYK